MWQHHQDCAADQAVDVLMEIALAQESWPAVCPHCEQENIFPAGSRVYRAPAAPPRGIDSARCRVISSWTRRSKLTLAREIAAPEPKDCGSTSARGPKRSRISIEIWSAL